MIPALRDAANDASLRGTPLTVYLKLLYELDPSDFQKVKQTALAHALKLTDRSIRDALKVLCERRYLERKDVGPNQPATYRLVYNRMPRVPLEDIKQ